MDSIPQDATPLKQCTGPCGRWLPATTEFFHRHPVLKCGLHPRCRECRSAQRKADRNNRPEIRESERANSKKWQRENVEYSREQKRLYHESHREESKAYYHAHKEQRKTYNHAWNEIHKEHVAIRRKAYYEAHAEELRANKRAYTKANPLKNRNGVHAYKARKRGNGGTYTPEQIEEQLKRQKYRCYYAPCGQAKFKKVDGKYIYHIDHVIPLSRKGRNDISNIVLACPSCNDKKHAKHPHEWFEGGRLM